MTAITLEWFQAPDPVQPNNQAMLGSVLQQWKETRKKIPVLPEVVSRLSVERLVSKLADVKVNVAAMKAAKSAAGVTATVDDIVAVIQVAADLYHSVAAQKKSVAMLASSAFVVAPPPPPAGAAPAGQKKPGPWKSKQPCWNFGKPKGCLRGDNCRFAHDGKPGEPELVSNDQNRWLSDHSKSQNSKRRRNKLKQNSVFSIRHESLSKVSDSNLIEIGHSNPFGVLEESDKDCIGSALMAIPGPPPAPPPPPPAPPEGFTTAEEARYEAYLIKRASGVAALLGVSFEVAKSLCLGVLQVSNSIGVTAMLASGDNNPVVADSGATVRVIGKPHMHLVSNERDLDRPITVNTADGQVVISRIGDLPGYGGLMVGCLLIPNSEASLLPVSSVCEELNMSYTIRQGGGSSFFGRDGLVMQELDESGGLHLLNSDSKDLNCEELDSVSALIVDPDNLVQRLTGDVLEVHNNVLNSNMNSEFYFDINTENDSVNNLIPEISNEANIADDVSGATGATGAQVSQSQGGVISMSGSLNSNVGERDCLACTVLDSKAMLEHRLGGHSRYSALCPECAQGKLRARQAFRKLSGSRANPAGRSVALDFTGPHPKGVSGGIWGLVGVEAEDEWGYVGIQPDRTAASTLKSILDLETQLKIDSGDHNQQLVSIHHDDDKSFRGEVEAYATKKGWSNTHTGGYNPNANSKCERRIGMLQQLFRVVLLVSTGGVLYYEQLWDVGLRYSCWVINTQPWPDRPSPISTLSGFPNKRSKNAHVFGAYCLFYIPKELRDGKFRPPSEMGIWVGLDPAVPNGHLVVPIQWQHSTQSWILGGVVTSTTVKVYDNVFPLKTAPPPGSVGKVKFNEFVDKVVNPLYGKQLDTVEAEPVEPEEVDEAGLGKDPSPSKSSNKPRKNRKRKQAPAQPETEPEYEVEKVVKCRIKGKVKQYRVKWKDHDNRSNSWIDADQMNSSDLIAEYHNEQTGRSQKDVVDCLIAILVTSGATQMAHSESDSNREAMVAECNRKEPVLPGLDLEQATEILMRRQNLEGSAEKFGDGINTELEHMLDKRLELIDNPKEAARIMVTESVVSLRMQLEAKKDGRSKARLLLQGFKEPAEWDLRSNVSPVAYPSAIKTLIFKAGPASDVISSIDVSVAFLQADRYGPDEKPRYVSYKPYPGGPVYVFKLLGPIYGQRSAPRAWYETLTKFLTVDLGYIQGENEPCLFTHPETGLTMVIHVDDILCRGSKKDSDEFYRLLANRFQCKDPEFLTPGSYLTFTGMDIGLEYNKSELIYSISQERELLEFLRNKGLDSEPHVASPMPNRNLLLREGQIDHSTASWVKSCLGGLHYFSRMTRWDISHAVSRIGQSTADPKQGTVDQLKQLAGFLNNTASYKISGRRVSGKDIVTTMTDSNHHGDPKYTSKSQSGVIILLNGIPVHWRSNRQPKSTLSPAESEIYALSTGVKDTRLYHWVLEEFSRTRTEYPILVQTDSSGARSFQGDTCPSTKLRGCFDFREKWVSELRSQSDFKTQLIPELQNLADIFTKCLSNSDFVVRREQIIRYQDARTR